MLESSSAKLPKEISPCPIVDAVIDIWFESAIPSQAIVGIVYNQFRGQFPVINTLPAAFVPQEALNANPALAHQASHRLEGQNLVILVGPKNFAVGIRGQYPGWPSLSSSFAEIVDLFNTLKIITRPERFGLRYVNFFSENVLPKLRLRFLLEDENLSGNQTFFRMVLPHTKSACRLLLQITDEVTLPSLPSQTGSVIDIDAFVLNPDTRLDFRSAVHNFLEDAHTAEKSLFYRLLSEDLLNSLNPIYPPNE